MSVKILPLYDAPHFATQVTDWLWAAFGETLSRDFFASVVAHSQRPEALPLTFIATEGETPVSYTHLTLPTICSV